MAVEHVTSPDGSRIGFERLGSGPPMVLIHGGTADRTRWAPVRDELADGFELLLVDRRGRGASAEEAAGPYDVAREGEDIAAVIDAAGSPAFVVGHSYGAIVALEAASKTSSITGLVLYEPASASPGHVPVEDAVLDAFESTLTGGDRERALEMFYERVVGVPREAIEAMRGTPIWEARLAAVHTALREGRTANAYDLGDGRCRAIDRPATVLLGTESPAWLQAAARQAADELPRGRLVELEGQGHMAIDQAPERFIAEVRAAASLV